MIPKVLHRIWVGGTMPQHLAAFKHDWQRLHPEWELRVWGDNDFGWLRNQTLFDNAAEFVPQDAVGQFKADVARYEILALHGGVYADCDLQPVRNFNDLLDVEAFAAWEQQDKFVGNTVLGSTAGYRLWGDMIARVAETAVQRKGKPATWVSGPQVLTEVLHRGSYPDFTVYPQKHFYPYSYRDVRTAKQDPALQTYDDCYAIHHWHHVRTIHNKNFPQ